MGVLSQNAMKRTTSIIFSVVCLLFIHLQYCECFTAKRGYRDPDDPRNLFAAMYGGNYKRSDPTNNMSGDYDHQLGALPHKRGLRDRDDPRNLFRSVYGAVFRR